MLAIWLKNKLVETRMWAYNHVVILYLTGCINHLAYTVSNSTVLQQLKYQKFAKLLHIHAIVVTAF